MTPEETPTGRLGGKVALITGAGSGIGDATARRFSDEGASVAVADIDGDAAARVATAINDGGGRAIGIAADVTRDADNARMVDETVAAFGGLDVFLANAGIERNGTVVAQSEEDWDAVFDVIVKGSFLGAKHAIPAMRERGAGSMLFTGSVGGLWGSTNAAAYSAAKAAVVNMTYTLALDHAHHHVRVNCVCPGGTRTPLVEALLDSMPEIKDQMDQVLERIVPLGGRLAEPVEVANAFVYLASDEASFVTGHALVVDGGQRAGLFMPEQLEH
jgi:NAD(P)-dependent dehydrogenase (short-subunit alcohol dehydrogenase family)